MTNINTQRGARIRELRRDKKLTQKDIGVLMDVSDTHVSKWERGEGINRHNIVKLATALETTVEYLEYGNGPSGEVNPAKELDDLERQARQLARQLRDDKIQRPSEDEMIRIAEAVASMLRSADEILKKIDSSQ